MTSFLNKGLNGDFPNLKTTFPLATYSASDCSGKELVGSCSGEEAKWEERRSPCKECSARGLAMAGHKS